MELKCSHTAQYVYLTIPWVIFIVHSDRESILDVAVCVRGADSTAELTLLSIAAGTAQLFTKDTAHWQVSASFQAWHKHPAAVCLRKHKQEQTFLLSLEKQ